MLTARLHAMTEPVWFDPIKHNNVPALRTLLDRKAFKLDEVASTRVVLAVVLLVGADRK